MGKKKKLEPLKRIAQIIENKLEYESFIISKKQRQEANILWIYDVLRANLGTIKRVKIKEA